MYKRYIKRILDLVLSLLALLILWPTLLVVALIVRINLGSPVIFKQLRVGKNERIFTIYKFRTMTDDRDDQGNFLPDYQRTTRLSRLLRSSSLDELPELLNILKGDLSIVGPRPLLLQYLPYYTEEERLRHTVRGGLTQPEVLYNLVNPTWEEQFKAEIDYTRNTSFGMDVRIIMATFKILFQRIKTDYGSSIRNPLDIERQMEPSAYPRV